ncbi:pollen-specific leucine-rich repeat extensin-like protein 4 [Pyrus communis]|uniref:pollen-specific leucine-rich repeat extensin-like protein 4 n=1 Tax=Pyrus communis TaxID=23211 RepID=UPI0035C1F908
MAIKMQYGTKHPVVLIIMLLLIAYVVGPVYADETPGAPGEEKCDSCTPSPPPPVPSPPPPSPCPPPPAPPPPSPCPPPPAPPSPPPSPKLPPCGPCGQYAPPPPSTLTYITGPPGQLYPIEQNFNGASRSSVNALPVLLGLLGLLAFW